MLPVRKGKQPSVLRKLLNTMSRFPISSLTMYTLYIVLRSTSASILCTSHQHFHCCKSSRRTFRNPKTIVGTPLLVPRHLLRDCRHSNLVAVPFSVLCFSLCDCARGSSYRTDAFFISSTAPDTYGDVVHALLEVKDRATPFLRLGHGVV